MDDAFPPLHRRLAHLLETSWESHLAPTPHPGGAAYAHVEGRLGHERLRLTNRSLESERFRRLHLELASRGDSLFVLHAVMWPRPDHDIPIFGLDVVGGRSRVSMAIVDLSPAPVLPDGYTPAGDIVAALGPMRVRSLPEWGSIFSPHCAFVRPSSADDEDRFATVVERLLGLHLRAHTAHGPSAPEQVAAAQRRYCEAQLRNDRTRGVLAAAFGDAWAERYMREVLFDAP